MGAPCVNLERGEATLDRPLSFGRFRLEPRGGLMSGAREIRLTPKALALLSFLAGRPGEVVTKEELFGAVWPDTNVGDAALVTCIQELRKALRDNARRPRYIETLHRRGYRFIGEKTSTGPVHRPPIVKPQLSRYPAAPRSRCCRSTI
jgi:DNA-binding winged helix-turn-helix (wHTH) protein